MKPYTRTLYLACLAAFTLFAVPAVAQNQVSQDVNKLQLHRAKPSNGDASAANNQERPKSHAALPEATRTCTYPFTTGSGLTYMDFCVTVNGNLSNFQSPAGVEMLDQDGAVEGYGICDVTANNSYYDYEYEDSGNWDTPIKVSSSSSDVKIERTTSDGEWTLTQTISRVTGTTPYAKVVMALKNNSGVTKEVFLFRFAGFLGDKTASSGNFKENYDGSLISTWGYIPDGYGYTSGDPYGLMLQNVGSPTPASAFYLLEGFAIDTENGPDPCDPSANWIGTLINAEGSGVLLYIEVLDKGKTGTVTDRYLSF